MDYNTLLNIKIKRNYFLFIFLIGVFFLSFKILQIEIYESYNSKAFYQDGFIYLSVPIDYSDTITSGEYLKINKEKYEYKLLNIGDIEIDEVNLINYQVITIEVDKEFKNKEVLDITIYYKKEKIFNKIKEIILWKEIHGKITKCWINECLWRS